MAVRQISDIAEVNGTLVRKAEFQIDGSEDLADIPLVAPGSVAYKADGSYVAVFNGEEWVQWGGGANE